MTTTFDIHSFDINSKLAIEAAASAPAIQNDSQEDSLPVGEMSESARTERAEDRKAMPPESSHPNAQDIFESKIENPKSKISLPGRVSAFFLNYKGRKLGPYYVRRWKEKGKAKKQYIKHEDLEQVQAACLRFKQDRNIKKARNLEVNNLIKNMAFMWHMKIRVKKGARLRIEDILHLGKIERSGMAISGAPKLRKPNHGFMAPLFAKWLRKAKTTPLPLPMVCAGGGGVGPVAAHQLATEAVC